MKTLRLVISSAIGWSLLSSGGASAHSFPEMETPSAGQTVAASPRQIVIKYDAPIEKLFATLRVVDADGEDEAIGGPEVSSDGYTLAVDLRVLKPGDYTVEWAVVGTDTHHTRGSYQFTVAGSGS
jgi:methionine-rich copper-binding protein CopC